MDSFSGVDADIKNYNVVNLRINTSMRTNILDPDTNCVVQLNQSRALTNVVKCDLNYVNIANVFHNVASYNNKFELSIYDISIGVPVAQYTVFVNVGYYNATELAAELERVIRAIDTRLQGTTIIYQTTLKRFITSTNVFQYFCDIEGFRENSNNIGNNFLWLFGANISTNVYRIGVSNTITPQPPNLYGATTVYICSRKLATTKSILELMDGAPGNVSSTIANEIMSIGINSAYGVYQTYYNNGSLRGMNTFSSGFIIDEVDLQFRDQWNNILESDRQLNPIDLNFKVFYV